MMRRLADSILLRIIFGEEDRYQGRSLCSAIVAKARESGLAGVTVLRGLEGFGRSRYIRTDLNIDAGSRLPLAIEIVDREERINQFLPCLPEMIESGLVTLERVHEISYPRDGRRSTIGAGLPESPDAVRPRSAPPIAEKDASEIATEGGLYGNPP